MAPAAGGMPFLAAAVVSSGSRPVPSGQQPAAASFPVLEHRCRPVRV